MKRRDFLKILTTVPVMAALPVLSKAEIPDNPTAKNYYTAPNESTVHANDDILKKGDIITIEGISNKFTITEIGNYGRYKLQ